MAIQASPVLQVTARRRSTPAGTYAYRITKTDGTIVEEGADPYPTREAALAAGHERATQLEEARSLR
jgi:hypothetical protein